MVFVSKTEERTIDDYVRHNLEFNYIYDTLKYYDYKGDKYKIIDMVLDDYNRINKTQNNYHSKINALRMFTIRIKTWDKNNYTDYEDLK